MHENLAVIVVGVSGDAIENVGNPAICDAASRAASIAGARLLSESKGRCLCVDRRSGAHIKHTWVQDWRGSTRTPKRGND